MYKLPRSIQVVIYSGSVNDREYLLLKRIQTHGGFWQSVTGSLEQTETHLQAAVREVKEETGISALEPQLIDLKIKNVFEIAPQWLPKYAPGTTQNEEMCFALRTAQREIVLDRREHDAYVWTSFDQAMGMLYWESNKRALLAANQLSA